MGTKIPISLSNGSGAGFWLWPFPSWDLAPASLTYPQEMQSPPGEAHSNSCAHNRCCCGTAGPSCSKECAWSRERLRGGLCHCCRTRAKFLSVPSCPSLGPLNISHALRATGGERQDSGSGSDPTGSEKRDLRLGPGGGVGHAGEAGL